MKFRPVVLLAFLFAPFLHAETPRDSALALYKAKHFPEARAAFAQLSTAEPQNAEFHYYLGLIAARRNETDEAIAQFEQATALDPKNSDYWGELGGAYGDAAGKAGVFAKMGLAKKCQTALEKSVELNPDNLDSRNGLVSYYRAAPSFIGGGMSKAYEQAEEIRKRNPTMGASVLGQLYIADKKYDEAFALFEDVLKASPDHYLALYSIGRTAAQTGLRLDRGEQTLHRCLELTPGKGEPSAAAVHWRLGNIAEKRQNPTAARAEYEAALKADPAFSQAKESLAKLK
ncbi:MAG: Tetratricopeptide repeat protein [Verrucomicrobia bacterium]|nr:Tetratricopeptide repeat protein [Verrucomicrobiota bacterium]